MSKDGKKPLGDSSVFQKGRKGAMRVIYGRTAIIAVSFLAQIILIGGVVISSVRIYRCFSAAIWCLDSALCF